MPAWFKAILASLLAIVAAEPRIHAAEAMRVGFETLADPPSVEQPDSTLAGFAVERIHGVARETARLAVLHEGLARIRDNGIHDRIYEKWIGPLDGRSLRFADLKPVVLPAILVALAVAAIRWWQRRRRRQLAQQTERLRASAERLRHVREGSEDGFWDWGLAAGRSERGASMLGYTLAEIPANLDAGMALVHRDDLSSYCVGQERINTASGGRGDLAYRMRTKSGDWR